MCTFSSATIESNYWRQKSDIWSQASYRCPISWEAFLDPSASYFLFADLIGFYTHWTYMHIFRHIFLSNYWRQKSDIWSQASYRYPISWEVFFDPSDSYFLFAEERGYHKWALAHSLSCFSLQNSQIFRRRKKLIKEKWDSRKYWQKYFSEGMIQIQNKNNGTNIKARSNQPLW